MGGALRAVLLLAAAAAATAGKRADAAGAGPSRGVVRSPEAEGGPEAGVRRGPLLRRRRKQPPLAYQMSELVFEVPMSEQSKGKPYLIQFKGKGDDYCAQMEPLKEQLKEELGVQIRCFEVWYDSKNLELMQRLDNGRCGGVPFFYNKRSRRYICGATTYANLRAWALSEPCEPILPPPNLNQENQAPQNAVQKFIAKVKAAAQEKLQQRGGDDDEEEE